MKIAQLTGITLLVLLISPINGFAQHYVEPHIHHQFSFPEDFHNLEPQYRRSAEECEEAFKECVDSTNEIFDPSLDACDAVEGHDWSWNCHLLVEAYDEGLESCTHDLAECLYYAQ